MSPISATFLDLLRLLNAHGARYLVVGGYAVVFHSRYRSTMDFDVWIAPGLENAQCVAKALTEFAFPETGVDPAIFLRPDVMIRMGVPPHRIELLTKISGVEFEACYPRRVTDKVGDIEVSYIGKEDLIVNKRASGRYKDLDDLDFILNKTRKPPGH